MYTSTSPATAGPGHPALRVAVEDAAGLVVREPGRLLDLPISGDSLVLDVRAEVRGRSLEGFLVVIGVGGRLSSRPAATRSRERETPCWPGRRRYSPRVPATFAEVAPPQTGAPMERQGAHTALFTSDLQNNACRTPFPGTRRGRPDTDLPGLPYAARHPQCIYTTLSLNEADPTDLRASDRTRSLSPRTPILNTLPEQTTDWRCK